MCSRFFSPLSRGTPSPVRMKSHPRFGSTMRLSLGRRVAVSPLRGQNAAFLPVSLWCKLHQFAPKIRRVGGAIDPVTALPDHDHVVQRVDARCHKVGVGNSQRRSRVGVSLVIAPPGSHGSPVGKGRARARTRVTYRVSRSSGGTPAPLRSGLARPTRRCYLRRDALPRSPCRRPRCGAIQRLTRAAAAGRDSPPGPHASREKTDNYYYVVSYDLQSRLSWWCLYTFVD